MQYVVDLFVDLSGLLHLGQPAAVQAPRRAVSGILGWQNLAFSWSPVLAVGLIGQGKQSRREIVRNGNLLSDQTFMRRLCRHLMGKSGRVKHWLRALWLFFVKRGETLQHLSVIFATIIAGLWGYHLFDIERQSMPHLGVEIQTVRQALPKSENQKIVFLDLILINQGKRKLQAEDVLTTQNAYEDPGEVLHHPCGIQVKQIVTAAIQTNMALDFFNNTNELRYPAGIPPEIDMLSEYELLESAKTNTATPQFWMEPGEQYHLGTTFILPKGSYLVRAHFIGNRTTTEEFWSRITFLQVD